MVVPMRILSATLTAWMLATLERFYGPLPTAFSMAGGEAVRSFIAELREIAEQSRAENRPGFGTMGVRLIAGVDELEES